MSRKLFSYDQNGDLTFQGTALKKLVGEYQNPLWIYRKDVIAERISWIQSWSRVQSGKGRLHYAMKANFNPEILKIFKDMNCGIDAVSVGEMKHALSLGFKPEDLIFSGVGKSIEELTWAVKNQIFQINIESLSEISKITKICQALGKKAALAIRVNPEVDAETHPGIATALKDSKFGLDFTSAETAIKQISLNPDLQLKALSFHIGSQITNVDVYRKAIAVVKPFYRKAKEFCPELSRLDLGGGLGIDYKDADSEVDEKRWLALQAIYEDELRDLDAYLILEIGRFLVARCGVLISRVEVIKKTETKDFLILDAGMSLLMRPALYEAYHHIVPLKKKGVAEKTYAVVGPICESSDVLADERQLPELQEDDLVAILDAGAYGSSMSSNYNLREPAIELIF